MAGLYIHIPFCKQKCSYCDFHFTVQLNQTEGMLSAMHEEWKSRFTELAGETLNTIYFGGGTPSILPSGAILEFIEHIRDTHEVSDAAEISLEANPDDMSADKLKEWKASGVNRLSVGIQSFDDALLTSMNRSHNAGEAKQAIVLAKELGFHSISVDIIFGLPEEGLMPFDEVVERFIALDVDHISAYALTIEKGTAYAHQVKKGELRLPEEEEVERQFIYLIDRLAEAGYEQYEVSNFARNGHISKHNSSYWKGKNYVGLGPSAHSYNGKTRRWNVSNNRVYIDALGKGESYWEEEIIDSRTALNEYLLTRSRTKWGLDLNYLKSEFGVDLLEDQKEVLAKYEGKYSIEKDTLILNRKGLLFADRFASDLFNV
jgi:oxygen-independent coproporphyrinogen-3 oxidase